MLEGVSQERLDTLPWCAQNAGLGHILLSNQGVTSEKACSTFYKDLASCLRPVFVQLPPHANIKAQLMLFSVVKAASKRITLSRLLLLF